MTNEIITSTTEIIIGMTNVCDVGRGRSLFHNGIGWINDWNYEKNVWYIFMNEITNETMTTNFYDN